MTAISQSLGTAVSNIEAAEIVNAANSAPIADAAGFENHKNAYVRYWIY
jgi:hypothetical protein